jgi:hypothetical protein
VLSILYRILQTLNVLVSAAASIRKTLHEIQQQQARDSDTLHDIKAIVQQIQDEISPGPAVRIIFTADLEGQITIGVTQMTMTDSQQVGLTIQPVDKKGNPAPVDGVPAWASSNTEVVTVTPAADGMSAVASAVGPLGTATVSVKADADLGSGVTEIAGTLDITITAGAAATVTITAGTPTDQ